MALGFLVHPSDVSKENGTTQIAKTLHTVLYLIPVIGIFVAIALTWIVVREQKWQTWYVTCFNKLTDYTGKVFPTNKGEINSSVGSQPFGRISHIVIGLGVVISIAWLCVLFYMYQI